MPHFALLYCMQYEPGLRPPCLETLAGVLHAHGTAMLKQDFSPCNQSCPLPASGNISETEAE